MYIWTASLKFAVTLCSVKVANIVSALEAELQTKDAQMSSTQWQRRVIEPCTRLVDALEVLNDEWGPGLAVCGTQLMFCATTFLMWLVSEAPNYAAIHSGLPWVSVALQVNFGIAALLFIVLPFVVASIPASLTSDCIALKDRLNALRLNNMTTEIDARITILERALDRVNGGQGTRMHRYHHNHLVHTVALRDRKNRCLRYIKWFLHAHCEAESLSFRFGMAVTQVLASRHSAV
jgi:hypothetical protein